VGRVGEDVGCGVGTLIDRDVKKRGGGTVATAASAAA
jgi:cyclopropane fatty-acyl-phospholipid synthase-like methyltransferase